MSPDAPGPGFGFNPDGSLFNVGPNRNGTDLQSAAPHGFPGPPAERRLRRVRSATAATISAARRTRWNAGRSFVKGDWALTNDIHFFGQALYTNYNSIVQSDATVTSATQVPTDSVHQSVPAESSDGQSRCGGHSGVACPIRPAPLQLNKRFLGLGGYRTATNANNIYQFIGGLNGVLGDTMTWDVYASHGQTLNTYSSTGAVRFSVVQQLLNAPDGGASLCAGGFNPFGNNRPRRLATPWRRRNSPTAPMSRRTSSTPTLQGTAFALPAGDVKFALGADYRNISFKFKPDAAVQIGDPFTFNPQAPTQGSSAVREVFGELLIPVIKDMPFFQSVNVDIAARYSDYVLSGGTNTYKGDVDWAVMDGWRLRGGYERAIRAPSVNELFSGNSTYYANRTVQNSSGAGDPCDVRLSTRTGPNGAAVRALCLAEGLPAGLIDTYCRPTTIRCRRSHRAAPPCGRKRADTFTGGTVWQPEIDSPWFQNASISVDYYNIRVRDAIAQLDFNTLVNKCFNLDGSNPSYSQCNFYCQFVSSRSQSNGQMFNVRTPFANTGGYKTAGIDMEANWLTDIGEATGWGPDAGTLSWDIVGNFQDYFKQQILPGQALQELGQTNTGGGLSSSATLGPFPKYQTNSTFTYHNFGADIGLRWRFLGGMKDSSYTTNPATTVPGEGAVNYFDAHLGYTLPETDTHFSLVINNLFDRHARTGRRQSGYDQSPACIPCWAVPTCLRSIRSSKV